eukprot:jgi/Bigna1/81372/fgenesh1_pg.80_\
MEDKTMDQITPANLVFRRYLQRKRDCGAADLPQNDGTIIDEGRRNAQSVLQREVGNQKHSSNDNLGDGYGDGCCGECTCSCSSSSSSASADLENFMNPHSPGTEGQKRASQKTASKPSKRRKKASAARGRQRLRTSRKRNIPQDELLATTANKPDDAVMFFNDRYDVVGPRENFPSELDQFFALGEERRRREAGARGGEQNDDKNNDSDNNSNSINVSEGNDKGGGINDEVGQTDDMLSQRGRVEGEGNGILDQNGEEVGGGGEQSAQQDQGSIFYDDGMVFGEESDPNYWKEMDEWAHDIAEKGDLEEGTLVVVKGLTVQRSYNALNGRIIGPFDRELGRYPVEIIARDGLRKDDLLLKPKNIRIVAMPSMARINVLRRVLVTERPFGLTMHPRNKSSLELWQVSETAKERNLRKGDELVQINDQAANATRWYEQFCEADLPFEILVKTTRLMRVDKAQELVSRCLQSGRKSGHLARIVPDGIHADPRDNVVSDNADEDGQNYEYSEEEKMEIDAGGVVEDIVSKCASGESQGGSDDDDDGDSENYEYENDIDASMVYDDAVDEVIDAEGGEQQETAKEGAGHPTKKARRKALLRLKPRREENRPAFGPPLPHVSKREVREAIENLELKLKPGCASWCENSTALLNTKMRDTDDNEEYGLLTFLFDATPSRLKFSHPKMYDIFVSWYQIAKLAYNKKYHELVALGKDVSNLHVVQPLSSFPENSADDGVEEPFTIDEMREWRAQKDREESKKAEEEKHREENLLGQKRSNPDLLQHRISGLAEPPESKMDIEPRAMKPEGDSMVLTPTMAKVALAPHLKSAQQRSFPDLR